MKKILSLALAAGICVSLFAADILTYVPIKGEVKSYTKTEFSIASKFGNYFRTPSVKIVHIFDYDGKEIESSELTPKDVELNSISSSYDNEGNLLAQVCTTAEGESIWRTEAKYKDNLKTELSEFDSKNSLKSKTLYKYENGNLVDETGYDGDGALLWKTIYKYTADNKIESVNQYAAKGNLTDKEVYTYSDDKKLASIDYYDDNSNQKKQEVFRYNSDGSLKEITTYDPEKQVTKRVIVKYESKGNPTEVSEWIVSPKFGTVVSELASQYRYEYNYEEPVSVQISEK